MRVHIALLQFAAAPDKDANLQAIQRLARDVAVQRPAVLVCPEASMFPFGSPEDSLADVAEPLDGPFVRTLADLARELETVIVAGMFETAEGDAERAYNTLVVLGPDGKLLSTYRKIHLYDAFGYRESDKLVAGDNDPVLVDVDGHRLGLLTCYDLRFPELARALAGAGADVLVVPAAWMRGPLKEDHWTTLVRARAIENTCYVAAADQCGGASSGCSMLVDPMGVVVTSLGEQVGVAVGEISAERVAEVRTRNPTLKHRRFAVAKPTIRDIF
ncbi:carbon-nitrogen hydrolase family protein [Actinopolymorpha pittospori]